MDWHSNPVGRTRGVFAFSIGSVAAKTMRTHGPCGGRVGALLFAITELGDRFGHLVSARSASFALSLYGGRSCRNAARLDRSATPSLSSVTTMAPTPAMRQVAMRAIRTNSESTGSPFRWVEETKMPGKGGTMPGAGILTTDIISVGHVCGARENALRPGRGRGVREGCRGRSKGYNRPGWRG